MELANNGITLPTTISTFETQIESMVLTSGIDYLDAILTYCEKNDLEIEVVGELIASCPSLLSKVECEAEQLHWIKPNDRLPLG